MQLVSSSEYDISPNSSNSSRELNIEQAINPFMAAYNLNSNKMHSSPSNSMADIPPVYFSSSSSNESLDRAPSLNYYYNGSFKYFTFLLVYKIVLFLHVSKCFQ